MTPMVLLLACRGFFKDDSQDPGHDLDSHCEEVAWYADADGDGYGDSAAESESCEPPVGGVSNATDCDDTRAPVHPGADEYCNDIDDDCDGSTDEDAIDASTWYTDADGDGYGDEATATIACDGGVGVADGTDCDDTHPSVHPGADEYCNDIDDDCDNLVDEDAIDATTWYTDADGDGFGDPATAMVACEGGGVADGSDCDDLDAAIYPGGEEIDGDGLDDDCDGRVDEIRACADATGDFSTIQEAIDAAPVEGGVVEICAGTYYESLYIGDRVIQIDGETGVADDVVIDGSAGSVTVYMDGDESSSYEISGLTVLGGNAGAIQSWSPGSVALSHFLVRDSAVGSEELLVYLYGTIVTVSDCEVRDNVPDDGAYGAALFAVYVAGCYHEDYPSSVRRCTFQRNGTSDHPFSVIYGGCGIETSNNILADNVADSNLISFSDGTRSGPPMFLNNTVVGNAMVGTGSALMLTVADDVFDGDGISNSISNNLFIGNSANDVIDFQNACAWCDQDSNGRCSDEEALRQCKVPSLTYNWFDDVEASECAGAWCAAVVSGNVFDHSVTVSASTDPPFSLDATSTAIDGGDPAAEFDDVDGSTNDPGRYGGPLAFE